MNHWNFITRAFILVLLLGSIAISEILPGTAFNPQPAEGDLVLPMPSGAEMIFRRVTVPGSNFWGDERRIIQIGDADGSIFEGLQRAQVSP